MPTKYATPFIDLFRRLTASEAKDLRASIEVQGVVSPVVVYTSPEHGPAIIDGLNRWSIASELKIDCPVDDRGELDDDVAEGMARDLNIARRQLSKEELAEMRASRREKVAELRSEGGSIRDIAEKVGATKKAVEKDLEAINKGKTAVPQGTAEPPETIKGRDGKKQPSKKPPKPKKDADDPLRGGNNFDFGASAKPATSADPDAHPGDAFVAELEEVCRELDKLKARIEAWKGNKLAYTTHWQSHVANIEAVRKSIWQGRPCHECPYCDGKGCDACKKTGRVQKSTYKAGLEATGKAA